MEILERWYERARANPQRIVLADQWPFCESVLAARHREARTMTSSDPVARSCRQLFSKRLHKSRTSSHPVGFG